MSDTIKYLEVGVDIPVALRNGFVETYKNVFAGPPYHEEYTDEQVLTDTWLPHLEHGFIILLMAGNSVIGFGCTKPLVRATDDSYDFVRTRAVGTSLEPALATTWYMSELGVLNSHRGRKLGYALVLERLKKISARGGTHYAMRTAANGSNSIQIYRNLGATELPGVMDISGSDQVQINKSKSDTRVYLYGPCDEAIRRAEELIR